MRGISLKTLLEKTGKGKSATYQDIAAGTFPAPLKDGRRSFWLEDEVDAWLEARKAERDLNQGIKAAMAAPSRQNLGKGCV